ncbi:MBL fold metallo-hydrolase [Patescibacteria group bacterium]|nr:MBL fold metallo-hydrolase [Patescibacteria group bacterium]
MKITFCGANREVTGSCYLIKTEHASVVLDCGMFQGGKYAEDKNEMPFPFDPAQVDAAIVTHAHFDHTGRLPKLHKEGFRGKLWSTKPTAELSMITLRDSVRLMQEEAERHQRPALYSQEEVESLEGTWQSIEYGTEREIAPGVFITLSDAGHILGSASVKVRADNQVIAFSGDLGNTPVPLLRNTQAIDEADIVVIESTYGNRVHEPGSHRYAILKEAIWEIVKNKGVLLLPSFAMERTQELLYELHHLHVTKQIPRLPIFLDSPMAIAATDVFRHHIDFLNTEAQNEIHNGEDFFRFSGLTFTEHGSESKQILDVPTPKIIIAGSGMMNGGRILHHLRNYLGKRNTILLIIGFQVEGSLGRHLHDGDRRVHIFGQEIDVHAKVQSCGAFSGHADYPRLVHWLQGFQHHPPRRVFVTHGELNSALSFSQAVEEQVGIASGVPEYGESVDIAYVNHPNL